MALEYVPRQQPRYFYREIQPPVDLHSIVKFLENDGDPNKQWVEDDLSEAWRGTYKFHHWPRRNTPLHEMLWERKYDAVEYLLLNGTDVNLKSALGRTALHEAAHFRDEHAVRLLLRHGADPNVSTENRAVWTQAWQQQIIGEGDLLPVHEALKNGDVSTVRILAAGGADINHLSPHGWALLDLALLDRQVGVMIELVSKGAWFSSATDKKDPDPKSECELAEELCRVAMSDDGFPPQPCHRVFQTILSTIEPRRPEKHEGYYDKENWAESTIRAFFKALSKIAQVLNLELEANEYCSLCLQFQLYASSGHPADVGRMEGSIFRHHNSVDDLQASSASCRMCEMLIGALATSIRYIDIDGAVNHGRGWSQEQPFVQLSLFGEWSGNQYELYQGRNLIRVSCTSSEGILRLLWFDEEVLRETMSYDHKTLGTASAGAFNVARGWMNRCTAHHKSCQKPTAGLPPLLPTRVIDVGGEDKEPFLFQSNGMRSDYCALSYCWGTSSTAHKTVKATLASALKSIPLKTLPSMLREAIQATRGLGFRYIWIDALCIIQDDANDWANEAAKMQDVYANATLTISSLTSKDSNERLFSDRNHLSVSPLRLFTRFPKRQRPPLKKLKYLAAIPPQVSDLHILSIEGHVHSRAWIFQEQVLSPRILFYSEGVVYWQCPGLVAHEFHPSGRVPPPDDGFYALIQGVLKAKALSFQDGHAGSLPDGKFDQEDWFLEWQWMVENYTTRSLTNMSDRVTAILGPTKVVADILREDFIGGIWKGEHCLRSLLWYTETPGRLNSNHPTWSWASLNTEIKYRTISKYYQKQQLTWKSRVISFDAVAGSVAQDRTSGPITIKGSLGKYTYVEKYVEAHKDLASRKNWDHQFFVDRKGDREALKNSWYLDIVSFSPESSSDPPATLCLLLEPVDLLANKFRRIGIYRHEDTAEGFSPPHEAIVQIL